MTRSARLLGLPALLLAILLAAGPAAAQADFNPARLPGLEAAVARSWVIDPAVPDADATTIAGEQPPFDGIYFAGANVFAFASEADARNGYDAIGRYFRATLPATDGFSEDTFTFEESDTFGDRTFIMEGSFGDENVAGSLRYILFQDDTYVFYAGVAATSDAWLDLASNLARSMDAQEEEHAGTGEVRDDGTSSGGLWEYLPPADDPMFAGVVAERDDVVFPAPDDED